MTYSALYTTVTIVQRGGIKWLRTRKERLMVSSLMRKCATFTAAVYINALQGSYRSLVSTATMPYWAPVHHGGILPCGVAVKVW
jgi:hypothetical protein